MSNSRSILKLYAKQYRENWSSPCLHNGRNSTAADRHPGTKTFHKISLSWFIAVIQFLILWLVQGHGAPQGLGALRLSLVSLLGNPPLAVWSPWDNYPNDFNISKNRISLIINFRKKRHIRKRSCKKKIKPKMII